MPYQKICQFRLKSVFWSVHFRDFSTQTLKCRNIKMKKSKQTQYYIWSLLLTVFQKWLEIGKINIKHLKLYFAWIINWLGNFVLVDNMGVGLKMKNKTRMYSSRMRTEHGSRHLEGGVGLLPSLTRYPLWSDTQPSDQTSTLSDQKPLSSDPPPEQDTHSSLVMWPVMHSWKSHIAPNVNRMTHACENITFSHTPYAVILHMG